MRSRVLGAVRYAGVPAAGALAAGVLTAWAAAPAHAIDNRAVAPYAASGAPAKGSTAGCADAPLLEPGRYTDSLATDRDLFYRVGKRGDQVLEVSATAVLAQKVFAGSELSVGAGWGEGDKPESWLAKTDNASDGLNVISVGARSNSKAVGGTSACIRIGNGIRPMEGSTGPFKVEVVVGLVAPDAVPGTGAGAPANADDGFSFAGAKRLPDSGATRGTVAIGEFPFWRVDLRAGQTLTVRTTLEVPADLAAGPQAGWAAHIYNPLRRAANCPAEAGGPRRASLAAGANRAELRCGPWTVEADKPDYETTYNLPGTYYIAVGVTDPKDTARGQVVPYELRATVDGVGSGPGPRANTAFGASLDDDANGTDSAASDDGRDGTDTVLMATAAGSALVSVASLGMHVRARRSLNARSHSPGHPLPSGAPGKPRKPRKPRKSRSRPMRLPADLLPGQPPAPAAPPETAPPPGPPATPGPKKRPAPPPLSIPPNHNALDSVWSISVVLGEDPDDGSEVPDTSGSHPAVSAEPPHWDGTSPDPRNLPSWRPGHDA
ncbi:hypothetical protein [Streptodolium elevatio]|uniref:Uncharacterized protein n=1 Tax=Streptodolium elevatio TaxID=3157996 RepID=A0ABV3D9H9_9ACTN